MTQNEQFKYDVRVRERMLKRGVITEAEVQKKLDALVGLDAACEELEASQPALGSTAGGAVPQTGSVGAEAGSDEDLEAP